MVMSNRILHRAHRAHRTSRGWSRVVAAIASLAVLASVEAAAATATAAPSPRQTAGRDAGKDASQTVTLAVGAEAAIPGTAARIRVDDVEDQRCPEDVECAWAGEAKVHFTVTGASRRPLSAISTVAGSANDAFEYKGNVVRVGEYFLRVSRLTPTRRERDGRKGDTATFLVRRTPFVFLDASLEPRRRERKTVQAPAGRRVWVKDGQSLWFEEPSERGYTQVEVSLQVHAVSIERGTAHVTATLDWVSANGRPRPVLNIDTSIPAVGGKPQRLTEETEGYFVELHGARRFIEDPRKGLNRPSPVGYEVNVSVGRAQ